MLGREVFSQDEYVFHQNKHFLPHAPPGLNNTQDFVLFNLQK